MNTSVDFSIIFPVMNQEDHIERVIRSYHKELTKRNYSFELIAVVNCSHDRSFEICQKIVKEMLHVTSYKLHDCGYGLGILHGLKKAEGKYLCYLNCARIHSKELLKSLDVFLKDRSVIVHGVRIARENQQRKVGSFLYNAFCRIVFQIPQRDINGNPNIFNKDTFDKLDLQSADSMIDLELLEKAREKKIQVVEVPIYDYSRHGGISTSNFTTIFRLMREVIRYWVKTRHF